MVDFRLSQLAYFCEVCRTGSVTRAAEALHIAQPSVSAAIRALKASYGVTLFHREKRRLIVMKTTSHQTGALIMRRFKEAGIHPNIILQSNQLSLIRQYIRSYGAVAF